MLGLTTVAIKQQGPCCHPPPSDLSWNEFTKSQTFRRSWKRGIAINDSMKSCHGFGPLCRCVKKPPPNGGSVNFCVPFLIFFWGKNLFWVSIQGRKTDTLQGTNISHLGTKKIIFKSDFLMGYLSSQEGSSYRQKPFNLEFFPTFGISNGKFFVDICGVKFTHRQSPPLQRPKRCFHRSHSPGRLGQQKSAPTKIPWETPFGWL